MFGLRSQHLIGMLAGALLGIVAVGLGNTFGYALVLSDGLFWGAVIGGVLAGVPQFASSGAILTRSENQILNLLVGLVGGLLFLAVTAGLVIVVMALLF